MTIETQPATSERVLAFLSATESMHMWVDGGWGVDALLGEQSRSHSDLDIIISIADTEKLTVLLSALSYEQVNAEEAVYMSPQGLAVDIHCVRFDERGYGAFELPDGRIWPFPPSAFKGVGQIGGVTVSCLSAEAQVQCHAQGYAPTQKDIDDMQALQRRFEVVLPLSLCVHGPST